MGEKIVVGPINKGLRNDVTPFNIDNDSFPTLINAYQWRGRVKRKRGTSLLGRLKRTIIGQQISSFSFAGPGTVSVNIFSLAGILASQPNASFVIPSVTFPIQFVIDPPINQTLTDLTGNGTMIITGAGVITSATINYATGILTLTASGGAAASITRATFSYYPSLPVMGLEEISLTSTQFPGTLAFDTTYSYNINTALPYDIYDVSWYKNLSTGTYTGYTQKTNWTPTTWNGQDYQQFWTVNYQGALWATNGINVPFSVANIGMQFKPIVTVTVTAGGPPATATLNIVGHGLVVGDFVFINEVLTTTGINFQTGYVIAVPDANNVSVEFPNATIANNGTLGIAQYLTSRSSTTIDCLRFYDGDPTSGYFPSVTDRGWVNFMPPLSQGNYSIADLPAAQYYLVGARMIVPFKDRLLFMGPVVQTSQGIPIYLQDTIIYSQNGTPYYTASFTGDASLSTTVFNPILVPANQTATAPAYWEDQTGFGGFTTAGLAQPIITSSTNEDVLIIGFSNLQTRLVYSGNDINPFNFYLINSELGSGSTFSAVNLDKGVMTRGQRGYIISSQVESRRFDLEIPDEVFQIALNNNGNERFTSQRDFINEWVYFTYPSNQTSDKFVYNTQTLQFNYRDNSWATFFESYTTYGSFRKSSGLTWGTVGSIYPTWGSWNVPWNAGSSTLEQPEVIAGNQQGFILFRDDGTNEGNSLYIQSISGSVVTSPSHCLNTGDYIIISGAIGTISSQVNGKIFSVADVTTDTFTLNPTISSGTYVGGGVIKRMYVPYIQSKQFPMHWDMARKTRIGVQQYLLTTTASSQIQLLIFLSQDDSNAFNDGPIVPSINTQNDSLIYSTVLYTCPESTNLGLSPANINLNMVTANTQNQTWHRINTSLIGDSVQVGFTMSDSQMRSLVANGSAIAITGATKTNPCILTSTANYATDTVVLINDVVGMTQLNGNNYIVLSSTPTTVTINVDATSFSTYISGGTTTSIAPNNQFEEIELHGFILDVTPSMVLA